MDDSWLFFGVLFPALALLFFVQFAIGRNERLSLSGYISEKKPVGRLFCLQDVAVGETRYKNSMTAIMAQDGLYLQPVFHLRLFHPPLLIPWSAFHSWEARKTYWWEVVVFKVRTAGPDPIELRIEFCDLSDAMIAQIEAFRGTATSHLKPQFSLSLFEERPEIEEPPLNCGQPHPPKLPNQRPPNDPNTSPRHADHPRWLGPYR